MLTKANAIRTIRTLDTVGTMLVMDYKKPLPPDHKAQLIVLIATLRSCIENDYGLSIDPEESVTDPDSLKRHLTPAEAAEDIFDNL